MLELPHHSGPVHVQNSPNSKYIVRLVIAVPASRALETTYTKSLWGPGQRFAT